MRHGQPNQAYANGASVSISVSSAHTNSQLTGTTGVIELPGDWVEKPTNHESDELVSTITFTPSTLGAFDGKIRYITSGDAYGGGTRSDFHEVQVRATVIDSTPTPTPAATNISAVSGIGVYGGTATLTATLKSDGTPVSGKIIAFELHDGTAWVSAGTANTDENGVAEKTGVNVSSFAAGFHSGAVKASFAGDTEYAASDGFGQLTVQYNHDAGRVYLQPINTTGIRSQFKAGSTIPVKFQLFMADGVTPVSTAHATISVALVGTSTSGEPELTDQTLSPDRGNTFRFEDGQYIFNLGMGKVWSGTYRITAHLDDGTTIWQDVAVRK